MSEPDNRFERLVFTVNAEAYDDFLRALDNPPAPNPKLVGLFRMNLYRGLSEDSWTDRLKLRGYPDHAARQIAAFLVGRVTSPPSWEELMEKVE